MQSYNDLTITTAGRTLLNNALNNGVSYNAVQNNRRNGTLVNSWRVIGLNPGVIFNNGVNLTIEVLPNYPT